MYAKTNTGFDSGLEAIEVLNKVTEQRTKLHAYEVAQLANLIPQVCLFYLVVLFIINVSCAQDCDYEVAVAWIPRLKVSDDDDIHSILVLIKRAKSRINTGY